MAQSIEAEKGVPTGIAETWKGDNFAMTHLDWEEYQNFRPPYPQSLYKLIYSYHQNGSAGWDSALDLGTGGGVVARELSGRFSHVVASDLSQTYLDDARKKIEETMGESAAKFDYLKAAAEDLSAVASSSVDMVTMAEAIHWTDHARVVSEMGRVLKPGGTAMAIVYTTMLFFPDEKDREANRALDAVKQHWLAYMSSVFSKNPRAALISNSELRCIQFDGTIWNNIQRYYWFRAQGILPPGNNFGSEPDRSGPDDLEVNHPDDGELTLLLDFEWIKNSFDHAIPEAGFIAHMKEAPWVELERLMGGKRLRTGWPSIMILARRN